MEETDVLVIGAGPSGCVASSWLQRNGVKVKVVEKAKFPRFVIGESLIPRVMDHFDEAGLFPLLDEQGFEKKFGARFIRGKEICVFDFGDKFGEGWDWTWQVPRADFDDTLTKAAQQNGVEIEFETEVKNVEFHGSNSVTTLRDKDGNERQIRAKFIIDSSGYGRVLPRLLNLEMPSVLDAHSSVFTHIKDINREEGVEGTQISFDILETQVWLWVIPFSNGNTSVGIVGPTDYIDKLSESGDAEEALRNAIKKSDYYSKRFGDLDFLFEPKRLTNYSCAVKQLCGEGYALTGNAAEFLDPVFSSGMAFATESGMLAAKLAKRQLEGETVDWEKEYAAHIQFGVDVFRTYVSEWYTGNLQKLFFHQPENPDIKRKICAVLAGYVWNRENPFVRKHKNAVRNLAMMIDAG
ncbi:tryptophan 7-halogenase [Cruoricaptor ignavus]|uniref:Tryptophan 7-halogenase n=1 Tax=Cruoricaptor ignavus TaxID=1118202 RepID=A0A7M1T3B4_9FLAO|nr:NAD(P)/FAD-dependent oxidoreductase [Cruoricaptor ignavus]QOR73402.1 tryptophan 7-halogenase [Cruoricaptor ignavus]